MTQGRKRWSLRGIVNWWLFNRKIKNNIKRGSQSRKKAHEHESISPHRSGMCHRGQSHMDQRTNSSPSNDTSTLSHEASTITVRSDFSTAALQPSLSMMPNLERAPYARSTHLELEDFDASTIPSWQSNVINRSHDQTKRLDCVDSGHSESCGQPESCGSSQWSRKGTEEQMKNCKTSVEVSSETTPESVSIEQDKLGTQVMVDESEVSVDISPSLSGMVLSGAGSLVGGDFRVPPSRSHILLSPELSPPLTIKNPVDIESMEEACRAESSISADGRSALLRTSSQITNVSRTSSRPNQSAVKTPSQSHQRYRAQYSRSEQLSKHEAQAFEERQKEIQQFMRDEAQRASLGANLSTGFYQQPSESISSLDIRNSQFCTRQHSTLSLPALQDSRSYATLPSTSTISVRDRRPSSGRSKVHYAQSMQNLCSSRIGLSHYDPRLNQSLAGHLHSQSLERSTSEACVDVRSISNRSCVDTGDQNSIQSRHSRSPSIASSLRHVQHRRPADPSPRHLRYPGGPTPVDARNSTAMDSHSSGSDPYSRPFTGFSGSYAHSQQPHSMAYSASGYQSEAEFLEVEADAQFARAYPHQFGHHQYSQSTRNFGRAGSMVSTSSYSHGPNSNPYLPSRGPLVTDVMTPSAPPRGQRRNPKGIPKLKCAANVNMAVSWDANGEAIGYHYQNPEDSVIKRWQGAVQASEELKELRSARVRSKNGWGEGRPANWKSPSRIHGIIHEEETFVPDGRGLYGYVSRGQTGGRLKGDGNGNGNGREPLVS